MMKLIVFLAALTSLSIADVALMRKKGLSREILPYIIIAMAAGIMGAAYFLAPYRDSVIETLMKIMHVSE